MSNFIQYNNKIYPELQTQGFASQYAFPFAKKFCSGKGYDIGCMKEEWALPGAIPVDINLDNNSYSAYNLPKEKVNYIFSSHCLEHLEHWVKAIEYWSTLCDVLFLYLPHYDQEYWRPWNNTKHRHVLTPDIVSECMQQYFQQVITTTGWDLNHSFYSVGVK